MVITGMRREQSISHMGFEGDFMLETPITSALIVSACHSTSTYHVVYHVPTREKNQNYLVGHENGGCKKEIYCKGSMTNLILKGHLMRRT